MLTRHVMCFLAVAVMGMVGVGCGPVKPREVALDYGLIKDNPAQADMIRQAVTLELFADARTTQYLYRKSVIMRAGDDAGIWVANALRIELEEAGAKVDTLPAGERPATGVHICGAVNLVEAKDHGWMGGGPIAAAIGTGFKACIDMTVEVLKEGVPVLAKQYSIKKDVAGNPVTMLLVGPTLNDATDSLQVGLRELIRTQVLPEVAAVLTGRAQTVAGDKP